MITPWSGQRFCGKQLLLQPLIIKGEDSLGTPGLYSSLQRAQLPIRKLPRVLPLQIRQIKTLRSAPG